MQDKIIKNIYIGNDGNGVNICILDEGNLFIEASLLKYDQILNDCRISIDIDSLERIGKEFLKIANFSKSRNAFKEDEMFDDFFLNEIEEKLI